MRICYVGNANSIHTRRWARYFAKQDHEVHLVSPWLNNDAFAQEMRSAGVSLNVLETSQNSRTKETHIVNSGSKASLKRKMGRWGYQHCPQSAKPLIDYFLIYNTRLRKLLRTIRPHLVHGWFLTNTGILAALSGYKPLVVSSWGADVILDRHSMQTWFHRFARRHSLRRADIITATCAYLASETAKYAPPGRKIHVIPFGVDCEQFHPRKKLKEKTKSGIVLGFAKHLAPKYGPEYLIKALKILNDRYPNLQLVMAGEGAMEQELRDLSANLGLQDKVAFEGYVLHEEMPAFLGQCDISVMPSTLHSEVFGVAALEASAMEIPVVATRVGGVSEVVIDGTTGFLVQPRDEEALAKAIATLIENPVLRKQMGQRGRKYVLSRYRWEDNAAQMAHLYEKLLETRWMG